MFVFSGEEKKAIRFFVQAHIYRYQSDEVFTRIENDQLTKADLVALDSKVRNMMGKFNDSDWINESPQHLNILMQIGNYACIVLRALNRYRSDEFNPDKYPKNHKS